MRITIKTNFGKKVALTLAVATIFMAGVEVGVSVTNVETNPKFMRAVNRKAKEMVAKAADGVLAERREQRKFDSQFNDIAKDL